MRSTAHRILTVFLCVVLLFLFLVPVSADSTVIANFSSVQIGIDSFFYISSDSGLVDVSSSVTKSDLSRDNWHFTEFSFPASYSNQNKYLMLNLAGLTFYSDTDYTVDFAFRQNFNSTMSVVCQVVFLSLDGNTSLGMYPFFEDTVRLSYDTCFLSGRFHSPSISGSYNVYLVIQANINGSSSPIDVLQRFAVGDFRFSLDSPLYGDHYENDTSEIDDLNNRIEAVEGELPSMEDVPLDELFGDVSIEDYNNGFVAVNNMFDTVIGVTDFGAVILFCLAIGLCTYLLGRRVRG